MTSFSISAVYGPVKSWRFGQSLGIDVIGEVSTCSYNCLYCQLGAISHLTCDRALFVPTEQIREELTHQDWSRVDMVTFSGSGEPTLALNLGDVMAVVRSLSQCPIAVLTNATLLGDPAVQQELSSADIVSVKLDAVSADRWKAVNRPAAGLSLETILQGIIQFRETYTGQLAIQTMVMEPWSVAEEERYKAVLNAVQPDEVQLNTPLRPRPSRHELAARGNHDAPGATWRKPRHVTPETLIAMRNRLQADLAMPVTHPYLELVAPV